MTAMERLHEPLDDFRPVRLERGMIDYRAPRQRTAEIGEYIDGVGVVLDQDNEVMKSLMESIGWQTKQIDESIRVTTAQIARSMGEIQ